MINIIEGVKLSKLCDYSFGDQASIVCNIYGGYMKEANIKNDDFKKKVDDISTYRNYMTLFIDNIRLYNRNIIVKNSNDQIWINKLMENNNLLELCSYYPNMNFIIFTNLEDTPINDEIENKIPKNVLSINSSNTMFTNNIVHTIPYGTQRKMNQFDNNESVLVNMIECEYEVEKLLYVNHNISTNIQERTGINEIFEKCNWATVDKTRQDYRTFLSNIKKHKFMICPIGNAIDCHRNWEVLYLNRIPVMKYSIHLEKIFKDYPVLFVDNYSDVTEQLLYDNSNLIESIDKNKLNLDYLFDIRVKEAIEKI